MTFRGFARYARTVLLVMPLLACGQAPIRSGPAARQPVLARAHFVASDGAVLPVRAWLPNGPARAALVALHGFNDYSRFFASTGEFLARHGVASYAYDQRGFGLAPGNGSWAGTPIYTRDLKEFTDQVRLRHPGVPLQILGESMGAAVAIAAMTSQDPPAADGLILSAPAVWGRQTMPWYQKWALELLVRLAPGLRLTGEGLHIRPSDNLDMLRHLGRDPLVIKATRLDAIYGLADLMGQALDQAKKLEGPVLILYGERDEVVPRDPIRRMLARLPPTARHKLALYEEGYHLLLRDLHADRPREDILAWLFNRGAELPSGADRRMLDKAG
ncbi:alpha/beta hydrolase [Methylococcus sp. EFPC2]|uniref:alpha/beta hydrolase n=1 Tax=Methylococcus sp. EFPC2 TaxID=2812648 RepID=UPI001F073A26|nr:alpha/beta hydrolase [Methylococcus sp. EFPC2]